MRPILDFSDNRGSELKDFKAYLPDSYISFIDPFTGGASIFFALEPERAFLSDGDSWVIAFYDDLVHNYPEVHRELEYLSGLYALHEEQYLKLRRMYPKIYIPDLNRDLYDEVRSMFNGTLEPQLRYATQFYFLNQLAARHTDWFNQKGQFVAPYRLEPKQVLRDGITEGQVRQLERATLHNLSFSKVMRDAGKGTFVFLSPERHHLSADDLEALPKSFNDMNAKGLLILPATDGNKRAYRGDIRRSYTTPHNREELIITNY